MKTNKHVITRNDIKCNDIKKWTSTKKNYKFRRRKHKGGAKMTVSKAYISCLDEEATKIFKKDLAEATLNLDIIKEGKELFKKLTQCKKEK